MSEPIAGTYEGYRLFEVGGHRLMSISQPFTYKPGVNHAVCNLKKEHDPPAKGCLCGFWLYHQQHRARDEFKAELQPSRPLTPATGYGDFGDEEDQVPDVVLGKVKGGGRAIIGDDGARVATVKVVALVTDKPIVFAPVLEHYGIGTVPPTPFTRGWIVDVTGNEVTIDTPMANTELETAPSSSMPACTSPRLAPTPSPSSNGANRSAGSRASADPWRSDDPRDRPAKALRLVGSGRVTVRRMQTDLIVAVVRGQRRT